MNQKMTKKERFLKWWSIEGKIEISAAIITLVILIVFQSNPLVEGIVGIVISLWCLGKIYFRRNQWALLTLAAIWAFQQGMTTIIHYFR